jgi:hypothetical protein
MTPALRVALLLLTLLGFGQTVQAVEAEDRPLTRNVVLVTTDGLRWQEVFRGPDESLIRRRKLGEKR